MTDWDLLTPGIGLSSIGIVGIFISLSGLAKTFIDGMHAVSLLTLLIGLIFLASGLFKDGFPTSRKAKVAAFITFGILIITGLSAMAISSANTPSIFIYLGIIILITVLAAAVIIGLYKQSSRIKLYLTSFGVVVIAGIITFSIIGSQSPEAIEHGAIESDSSTDATELSIDPATLEKVNILPGSAAQGNPDYDPDHLIVSDAPGIVWLNIDNVPHTVTSLADDGQTFDSSIISPAGNYTLILSDLPEKNYEYFCTLHPYMKASFASE
ncbi:MAG: hypothetical protein ACPKQO_03220 [Nitrososphaeraceae archaeon]